MNSLIILTVYDVYYVYKHGWRNTYHLFGLQCNDLPYQKIYGAIVNSAKGVYIDFLQTFEDPLHNVIKFHLQLHTAQKKI